MTWPNGQYFVNINVSSFQNNLSGLSMTADEVKFWIPYSLSMWRERTGVQDGLSFAVGTTTGTPDCNTTFNGSNEVYASPGCAPGQSAPCMSKGTTRIRRNVTSNTYLEADTCIWGASVGPTSLCTGSWRVRSDDVGPLDWDLRGTLVHEFGHALALDHNTSPTVMLGGGACGSTWRRYPFGEDIQGMRASYPPASGDIARWREFSDGAWGPENTAPGVDGVWGVHTAIGRSGSGEKVVATELSDDGTTIGFNRSAYPLSSSSTWSASFATVNTWRPIAVAARPLNDGNGELWVAAVSREQVVASDCPGLRIYRSSNTFSSRSSVDMTSQICGSAHEPALTYDRSTGRFVLFYVLRNSPSGDQLQNDKIFATTSTDGVTWTAPQDLTIFSVDAVDAACPDQFSKCILSFMNGSTSPPRLRNTWFSVKTKSPYILLHPSGNADTADRTPAAGVRTVNGAPEWFLSLATATPLLSERANGTTLMFTTSSASNPITFFPWISVADSDVQSHQSSFASTPASDKIYFWYVR